MVGPAGSGEPPPAEPASPTARLRREIEERICRGLDGLV